MTELFNPPIKKKAKSRGRPLKASRKDPQKLGAFKYEKQPLDTYFTPAWCVHALLDHYLPDQKSLIWEPFVGAGNIASVLQERDYMVMCSDLKDYGYPMTMRMDFRSHDIEAFGSLLARDISNFSKEKPEFIITNPPYTKLQSHVERIIGLAQSYNGGAALLMRNEFDCGKTRKHIFQNCSGYRGKIILTARPKWFSDKEERAAPRHNFAWYIWDYTDNMYTDDKKLVYSYRGEGYDGKEEPKRNFLWNESR